MPETENSSDVPVHPDVPPDDQALSEISTPVETSTSESTAMEVINSDNVTTETNVSESIEPAPPEVKVEPTLPAAIIEKSVAMITDERRESCDTGYSSLENGEYKQMEECSIEITIRDVLNQKPPFPIPESAPSDKKAGRGRPRKNLNKKTTPKNNKKAEKDKSNVDDDKEKESDEPRRSTRLKSKTDNTVRMEDLLNSININEIVKTIEENSLKSNGCDIPLAVSNASSSATTTSAAATASSTSDNNNSNSSDLDSRPPFKQILENEYFTERSISKDAERMICDCVLTKEEIIRGEKGCGDDCLNRLLLIECCSRCTLGERCSNKRFQKKEYAKCETFKTKKKGHGLRVLEDIPSGTFIMEYVGEVIDSDEFETRAMEYARGKIPHFYFMSLKSDCIIDATVKGNISRFINHSCEPNAETQKWTVQGELRIGFFSKRDISAGEEVTFDYQLQRYGKQAQRCYCETPSCSGWIGEDPEKQPSDDKKKEKKKKKADIYQDWETALDEICQVGLINRHQTLSLNRLMVHAKELAVRMQILQLIEEGHPSCRRLFVDYHGLPIIWSWMVDCTPEQDELKTQLLKTLLALPITNKTILIDSKVLPLVEQWAYAVDQKPHSEQLSAQSVLESVEDIASADETPVSEMAQKVLEVWSSLREMYRIPRKERIQQMKEHEREADQNIVKPRPKRLPLYVENMRDRYQRNRLGKDKDFDKIYFDRMKDYDKSGNNNSFDFRKRKSSPDRRNFDNRNQRKFDSQPNKLSKMEHRYLFEKKFREKERKEEQQYWYQNAQLYYANQQHAAAAAASISNLINSAAAHYLTSVPPPSYSSDSVYSPMSSVASSTPTNNFFNTPPPNMYQNVVLPPTHIPPPSLPPVSASPAPSAQPYYQNPVHVPSYPPPTPVSYPIRATASTPMSDVKPIPTTCQLLTSPAPVSNLYEYSGLTIDDIPVPGDIRNIDLASPATASTTSNTSSTRANSNGPVKEINPVNFDINKMKLPPKWKTARDGEGRLYFYHKETRVSQWYPPKWEDDEEEEEEEEIEVTDEESSSDADSTDEEEEDLASAFKDNDDNEQENEQVRLEAVAAVTADQREDETELNQETDELQEERDEEDDAAATAAADETDLFHDMSSQHEDEPVIDTPTGIPLVTEHIISPREPIDEDERIRNKLRRRYLKEKMRKRKKEKMLKNGLLNGHKNGSRSSKRRDRHMNGDSDSTSLSADADTSEMSEDKKKDLFRFHMAKFIVTCLNPYFRSSCTQARITNYGDFKHLAKKLTHFVMLKELKHCQNVTDLACNASVKYKAKEYVRKYMSKFDEVYVRPVDDINY
ncbi:histone-lysine N-methyltransferase SETD2-like [Planococcus citri]|uniref:histone-lysine N-methyltransferase SETD2-like n=1 Tax=Planococcus citri TaxID=170843 RepID=UPI0031FA0D9D